MGKFSNPPLARRRRHAYRVTQPAFRWQDAVGAVALAILAYVFLVVFFTQ
jgi:hypothetical protein